MGFSLCGLANGKITILIGSGSIGVNIWIVVSSCEWQSKHVVSIDWMWAAKVALIIKATKLILILKPWKQLCKTFIYKKIKNKKSKNFSVESLIVWERDKSPINQQWKFLFSPPCFFQLLNKFSRELPPFNYGFLPKNVQFLVLLIMLA